MNKRASARKLNGAKPARAKNRKRVRARRIRPHPPLTSKLNKGEKHPPELPRTLNGHARIEEIAFYRANEKPYGVFSNLYRRPIVFEEIEFPTAEHAYQAGKARRKEVRDWLLKAPTPSLLAMAAHGLYTWDIAPDWTATKYDRMRKVLYAKFTQHKDLKQLLLNTGNARLVETGTVSNAVNKTWGEVNGKGLNMLGRILMEVRTLLRNEAKPRRSVHTLVGKPPLATAPRR
jgi:ribA/ribD-fused uncharacterized protein